MAKLRAQKHLHSYRKVKFGKSEVFRCTKIDCGHFLRPEFITGRQSECPYCHETFVIGPIEKRMKIPHCAACRERMRNKYFGDGEPKPEIQRVRSADEIAELFLEKFEK